MPGPGHACAHRRRRSPGAGGTARDVALGGGGGGGPGGLDAGLERGARAEPEGAVLRVRHAGRGVGAGPAAGLCGRRRPRRPGDDGGMAAALPGLHGSGQPFPPAPASGPGGPAPAGPAGPPGGPGLARGPPGALRGGPGPAGLRLGPAHGRAAAPVRGIPAGLRLSRHPHGGEPEGPVHGRQRRLGGAAPGRRHPGGALGAQRPCEPQRHGRAALDQHRRLAGPAPRERLSGPGLRLRRRQLQRGGPRRGPRGGPGLPAAAGRAGLLRAGPGHVRPGHGLPGPARPGPDPARGPLVQRAPPVPGGGRGPGSRRGTPGIPDRPGRALRRAGVHRQRHPLPAVPGRWGAGGGLRLPPARSGCR